MIDVIYQITNTLLVIVALLIVIGKLGAFDKVPEEPLVNVVGTLVVLTIIMSFISGIIFIWS